MKGRRRTTTSNFGVGARESHDSSPFYDRFRPPQLSDDDHVPAPQPVAEPFVHGDARRMDGVADGSVALVVTSPPYFAGKQYEEELEREGIPASYLEYLEMLTEVFTECVRTLEPGGRIAVNVANLGRKPYRSLSADVIRILEHDLGLLLRGELIWQKGEGASGSCAWGSFRSATNPVLRDLSERVIVASKGRFDRARTAKQRAADGLPYESTLMTDDFLAMTLDIWSIASETRDASRPSGAVSGGAARAADPSLHVPRRPRPRSVHGQWVGARRRCASRSPLRRLRPRRELRRDRPPACRRGSPAASPPTAGRPARGRRRSKLAEQVIEEAGFTIHERTKRIRKTGVTIDFVATDADGASWFFDVCGAFTSYRGGLLRMDTVWRSLGRAHAVRRARGRSPSYCSPATCPDARARVTQPCGQPVRRRSSTPSRCCRTAISNGCGAMPRAASPTTRNLASGRPRSSPDEARPPGSAKCERKQRMPLLHTLIRKSARSLRHGCLLWKRSPSSASRREADGRRSLVASRPVLAASRPRNAPPCASTRSVADNAPDLSWLRPQNRGALAAAGNRLRPEPARPAERDDRTHGTVTRPG